MKYLSFLFVMLIASLQAQNQRFTYQYHFAGDKSKPDDFYTEMMALDVNEEGSKFYSIDKMKSDSIMSEEFQRQRRSGERTWMGRDERSKVSYSVEKSYPNYDITLTIPLGRDTFIVDDKRTINWQITGESKKVGEWEAQKAVADFAGRKWEAWFTMEIPIPDGPYKFRGLPGLIVSVNSEDETHQYQLISVRNLNLMDQLTSNRPQTGPSWLRRQPLRVSSKQFVKQREKFYADPTAEFRQRSSSRRGGGVMRMRNQDGSQMTAKDFEKILKERIEIEKQENSNPVELDMVG